MVGFGVGQYTYVNSASTINMTTIRNRKENHMMDFFKYYLSEYKTKKVYKQQKIDYLKKQRAVMLKCILDNYEKL